MMTTAQIEAVANEAIAAHTSAKRTMSRLSTEDLATVLYRAEQMYGLTDGYAYGEIAALAERELASRPEQRFDRADVAIDALVTILS